MSKPRCILSLAAIALCLVLTGFGYRGQGGLPAQGDVLARQGYAAKQMSSQGVALLVDAPSILSQRLDVSHTTENPSLKDMADLDGDGDMDLLGTSGEFFVWDDETLFWWENDGQLGFSERVIATGQEIISAQAMDMDGDGDMDIVTYAAYPCNIYPCTPPSDEEIFWWENDGNQNFTKQSIREVTLRSTTHSPVLVDLDKDGDGDLVIYTSSDVLAWIENAPPDWVYHSISSGDYDGGEDFLVEDFDGDGDLDIALANDYTHPQYGWLEDRLDIWVNDGSPAFPTRVRLDSAEAKYTGNEDLKAVDFDGDGDLDLLTSNGDVDWWENQGELAFTRQEIIGNFTYNLNPGDLDGDNDIDILYRHGNFWVYLENLGAGVFQRRSIALVDPQRSITGDLDNDGRIDMLVYGTGNVDWLAFANAVPASLPFYDGFEEPFLGNEWENLLSEEGKVWLQSDTVLTGTQSLFFNEPAAEIILYLDLSGEEQVELSFVLGNELEPAVEDGVYISDDGLDWHLVVSRTQASTTEWTQFVVDLDVASALNGLELNDQFRVKFVLEQGGFWLDEVKAYVPGSAGTLKHIYLPAIIKQE
jgi:hypothetical protein